MEIKSKLNSKKIHGEKYVHSVFSVGKDFFCVYELLFDDSNPSLWACLVAQLVKNPPTLQKTPDQIWVGKIPWRRDRLPTPVFLGSPGGWDGLDSTCNMGDLGSIPG